MTALPVKLKSTPLVRRTPSRLSVTFVEMFLSSMYSNSSGTVGFPDSALGWNMISDTRRNCCAGLGVPE